MHILTKISKEYWHIDNALDNGIVSVMVTRESAFETNRLNGRLPFYAFTVVAEGQAVITYNDKRITLSKSDLYTYMPGVPIMVDDASDNYLAYSILAEEDAVFDSPVIRNIIKAAYFPIVELHEPKLPLSESNADKLCRRMQEYDECQASEHTFKADMLRILYSAFLLDLLDIQERSIKKRQVSERAQDLFLGFLQLLPDNFAEHHDIAFYAGKLCVTTIYLSRIVHGITGRTVMDYINQMLLMEASWLLQHTDKTVVQIAEELHFADHASFSRFFKRLKGVRPKEYRAGDQ